MRSPTPSSVPPGSETSGNSSRIPTPRFSGADSAILLREAMRLAAGRGYRLGNVDATIIAQEPKLARHLPAMIAKIAQALSCEAGQVNLKAKTNERLGYLGRAEGIEAQAVVLLAGPAVAGATAVAVATGLVGAD